MPKGPIPVRTSLVTEALRVMKQRIADNEWPSHLPGERSLANTLHVGRDTIRMVLQELENDGWILPAQPGCRRMIAPDAARKQSSPEALRVGVLSPQPLEQLQQPMLLELDHIRGALAAKDGSMEFFSPRWHGLADPSAQLETLIAEARCSSWILLRSTEAIQRWFHDHKIRCIVRGSIHAGIQLPFLDVDWEATARHAAGRLWRLGHRRVALLVPTEPLLGIAAAKRGIQGFNEDGFEPIEVEEDGTAAGLCRAAEAALISPRPPSAFIATRPRQVATLLTWLGSHGIRVPGKISIISLADEQFLDHLVPAIDRYRTSPSSVARRVVRRVTSLTHTGNVQKHKGWIIPKPIPGGSTGPAK
ncbi:substrate-binding domain-containing protein [Sulfuriroseicoccus oceanibius]|uniref:Substrate-binding domain-containing protein n=1 Tax=Sulfuriroseicoccus oceanibius TaxID=2707525 RepID=A0A6B3LEV9_9BACT|nr:substrate-binding domain-containing protein [Sulfuriroseicoccus oceanibius]QQL45215.1 substrate-binding domain-containing protein [Sulfuriroseicoccus oceanibius]